MGIKEFRIILVIFDDLSTESHAQICELGLDIFRDRNAIRVQSTEHVIC